MLDLVMYLMEEKGYSFTRACEIVKAELEGKL